jgi:hypothetical protein
MMEVFVKGIASGCAFGMLIVVCIQLYFIEADLVKSNTLSTNIYSKPMEGTGLLIELLRTQEARRK